MPQSTDERRARWRDDTFAQHYLMTHGFVLTEGFNWIEPAGHIATWLEHDAIMYLCQEWDYGGVLTSELTDTAWTGEAP